VTETRWRELFAFTRRLGLAPEVKLRAEERPLAPRVRVLVQGRDLSVGDETAPLGAVEWVRVPLFVVNRREGRVRDHSAEIESLLAVAGIPYEREAAAVVIRAGA
jgi:hypothetical protein